MPVSAGAFEAEEPADLFARNHLARAHLGLRLVEDRPESRVQGKGEPLEVSPLLPGQERIARDRRDLCGILGAGA